MKSKGQYIPIDEIESIELVGETNYLDSPTQPIDYKALNFLDVEIDNTNETVLVMQFTIPKGYIIKIICSATESDSKFNDDYTGLQLQTPIIFISIKESYRPQSIIPIEAAFQSTLQFQGRCGWFHVNSSIANLDFRKYVEKDDCWILSVLPKTKVRLRYAYNGVINKDEVTLGKILD